MRPLILPGVVLTLFMAASCSAPRPEYRIPVQHFAADSGVAATPPGQFITMTARDADDFILEGVYPRRGRDPFRWTSERARLRFAVPGQEALDLRVELAVTEAEIQGVGPVSIHFTLEGRDLGTLVCSRADRYRFEKTVPGEWTAVGHPVEVTATTSPVFRSEPDGLRYGFLLFSAGLYRR